MKIQQQWGGELFEKEGKNNIMKHSSLMTFLCCNTPKNRDAMLAQY